MSSTHTKLDIALASPCYISIQHTMTLETSGYFVTCTVAQTVASLTA